jgi:ribosomal protein S13
MVCCYALCCIPGIGEKVEKKIEQNCDIHSVMQLSSLSDSDVLLVSTLCSLSVNRVKQWKDMCQDMLLGKCIYPKPFDFVQGQTNPYAHRYSAEWRTKINKVTQSGLTKVTCVTDLIKHIDRESKRAFINTKYKDTYSMWSHDALTQMCDKACKISWLKITTGTDG